MPLAPPKKGRSQMLRNLPNDRRAADVILAHREALS
jgi:hypothetical protein